jgi:hypothetical protein
MNTPLTEARPPTPRARRRLFDSAAKHFIRIATAWAQKRRRYRCIKDDNRGTYLERWTLLDQPWCEIVIHHFCRDDADDPHDHQWDFVTLILAGGYREERYAPGATTSSAPTFITQTQLNAGRIALRRAETVHRVFVDDSHAFTLCVRSRKRRRWGFWTAHGFIAAEPYINQHPPLTIPLRHTIAT